MNSMDRYLTRPVAQNITTQSYHHTVVPSNHRIIVLSYIRVIVQSRHAPRQALSQSNPHSLSSSPPLLFTASKAAAGMPKGPSRTFPAARACDQRMVHLPSRSMNDLDPVFALSPTLYSLGPGTEAGTSPVRGSRSDCPPDGGVPSMAMARAVVRASARVMATDQVCWIRAPAP